MSHETTNDLSVGSRDNKGMRIVRKLADSRELTLFVLVAALILVMSAVYPNNFPTASNLRAVLLNLAPVGILVCGMMLLMIAGSFRSVLRVYLGAGRGLGRGRCGNLGLSGRGRDPGRSCRRRFGRADKRADRHETRDQRADRHLGNADDLPLADLCDGGHRRDPDFRCLRRLWPGGRPDLPHPVAVLGDAGRGARRQLAGVADTLLPAVLLRRRQCAGGAALRHPRRAARH